MDAASSSKWGTTVSSEKPLLGEYTTVKIAALQACILFAILIILRPFFIMSKKNTIDTPYIDYIRVLFTVILVVALTYILPPLLRQK